MGSHAAGALLAPAAHLVDKVLNFDIHLVHTEHGISPEPESPRALPSPSPEGTALATGTTGRPWTAPDAIDTTPATKKKPAVAGPLAHVYSGRLSGLARAASGVQRRAHAN
eukprot:tig00001343_g8329.t1